MGKCRRICLVLDIVSILLAGCELSHFSPPATPAALPSPTLVPTATVPVPLTRVPPGTPSALPSDFCSDAQATALIEGFKKAIQTSDGDLLASLVGPVHGMDARLYRDGRVINYDREHAAFLFDSTYVVDWGPAPGSGLETLGTFRDTILPDLLDVFNKTYMLSCNQVVVGGTTYHAGWPYPGIGFYSVFYPGSQGSGSLDWHTWLFGMEYIDGRPYLYAIMQFQWEP